MLPWEPQWYDIQYQLYIVNRVRAKPIKLKFTLRKSSKYAQNICISSEFNLFSLQIIVKQLLIIFNYNCNFCFAFKPHLNIRLRAVATRNWGRQFEICLDGNVIKSIGFSFVLLPAATVDCGIPSSPYSFTLSPYSFFSPTPFPISLSYFPAGFAYCASIKKEISDKSCGNSLNFELRWVEAKKKAGTPSWLLD